MQQPEKAAAEAEAERGRGFHLEEEAGVVEPQPAHGAAQILEIGGIDREQSPQNTTGWAGLKPGSGLRAGRFSSVMVSPTLVSATSLMEAVKKPISPGPSVDRFALRA